ncbi:uncharacterized protein ATC70_013364 [Mucor velutinosus]|uniref:UspA domain-containing protein n=1 Tax=Mucor velutinosus TaxID=708070 RepID=A0AAN7HY31_9FUNG|nr:hypothetical protein ATC70_013364 [Mucor velutinosus]
MPDNPNPDDDHHAPTVAINNVPITSSIPLTTEEPVRRPWLKTELEELNNEPETYPEDANIADEDDDTSNASDTADSDEDSITGQNKIKNIIAAEKKNEDDSVGEEIVEEPEQQRKDEFKGGDILACLAREMSEYQEKQDDMTNEYERKVRQAETEDDLLQASDPDLLRRTESNRHIPYDEVVKPPKRSDTIHGQSDETQRDLLVFSDNPTVIEQPTQLSVVQYYGAGKSGVLPAAYRSKRKPRSYLVACDFSKESLYAMEWTMGTMMRDGDELHVATIANRDDNPDVVKATGLDPTGELHATSDALIAEAKKLLGQMMLFNIKLVTHAMIGRVKDMLKSLTREHNYTMLVCGSRGRGSVRTLLMGSVSTYLVHKSPVPVAVIRRQKKKKRVKHQIVEAHSLSESVKSGHLHVDELS